MLIRLQEVEVIDEEDLDVEPPPSDWSVPDVTAVKWPDYEAMVKMPFDHTLRHGRSKNHSPVWTQKVKLGKDIYLTPLLHFSSDNIFYS